MTPERPPRLAAVASRHRATRHGAAIDAVLADRTDFRTAQDLQEELQRRQQPVGLATVYRQLRKLADAGALDVVTRPDGEAAYRLCGPATTTAPEQHHHHHLVCRLCGRTVEVDAPQVEAWADRVARKPGSATPQTPWRSSGSATGTASR